VDIESIESVCQAFIISFIPISFSMDIFIFRGIKQGLPFFYAILLQFFVIIKKTRTSINFPPISPYTKARKVDWSFIKRLRSIDQLIHIKRLHLPKSITLRAHSLRFVK